MQVCVGNLFDSIVYHVHMEPKDGRFQISFLVYDPHNRIFDVVDADQCTPLDISAQRPEIAKKISHDSNRRREIEIFKKDAEKLANARKRQEERQSKEEDH